MILVSSISELPILSEWHCTHFYFILYIFRVLYTSLNVRSLVSSNGVTNDLTVMLLLRFT